MSEVLDGSSVGTGAATELAVATELMPVATAFDVAELIAVMV